MKIFKIAEEFYKTPGAGYIIDSDFSGEELNNLIFLMVKKAIANKEKILIDLDGTYGYAPSFLNEAFSNFGFYNIEDLKKYLVFKSDEEPYLIDEIWNSINEWKEEWKI